MVSIETKNAPPLDAGPTGNGVLRLDALTRQFGDTVAVDNVSLTVEPGEMVGVIGSSGAGKSTLLRMINRLVEPSSGRVEFDGREITALRGRALRGWRADCAMIFQGYNLSGRLTALANVLVGCGYANPTLFNLAGHFRARDRERAVALLHRMDLLPVALQRAETLSGGQQQRVAIARALMQNPRLVLADEPVSALDPRNADAVMRHLAEINTDDGIGVIVNLHSLDIARRYCTRIIGMRKGAVVFDGPAQSLDDASLLAIYGAAPTQADLGGIAPEAGFYPDQPIPEGADHV